MRPDYDIEQVDAWTFEQCVRWFWHEQGILINCPAQPTEQETEEIRDAVSLQMRLRSQPRFLHVNDPRTPYRGS